MVKSREEKKAYEKDYKIKNKDKIKAYNKEYYLEHKDKVKAQAREYYLEHKDKVKVRRKDYIANNRQKLNDHFKKRFSEDITFKLKQCNRNRIRAAMRNLDKGMKERKRNSSQELLGCTYSELKMHLQSQLPDGEDLQNYSIDHIIPCAAYDLTKEQDMRRCFHYLNTQPMKRAENSAKGAKLPPPDVLDEMIDLWPASWPLKYSSVTLKLKWNL